MPMEAALSRPRFHLAFPVRSVAEARTFYGGVLGCPEGRSTDEWIDFDLHGHQLSAHVAPMDGEDTATSLVDDHAVPLRHFGLILEWDDWEALAKRLEAAGVSFELEPQVRFKGAVGEQATLFVRDPSGNALEFKAFRDEATIFAR